MLEHWRKHYTINQASLSTCSAVAPAHGSVHGSVVVWRCRPFRQTDRRLAFSVTSLLPLPPFLRKMYTSSYHIVHEDTPADRSSLVSLIGRQPRSSRQSADSCNTSRLSAPKPVSNIGLSGLTARGDTRGARRPSPYLPTWAPQMESGSLYKYASLGLRLIIDHIVVSRPAYIEVSCVPVRRLSVHFTA
jgi:hypothetical protein